MFDLPGAGPVDYRKQLRHEQRQNDKMAKELAEEKAARARAEEREAINKWRYVNVGTVVGLNMREMGLDLADGKRLDNYVSNAFKAHRDAGKPYKSFPVYDVISAWKANHGRAVAVPHEATTTFDAHLPPPRPKRPCAMAWPSSLEIKPRTKRNSEPRSGEARAKPKRRTPGPRGTTGPGSRV